MASSHDFTNSCEMRHATRFNVMSVGIGGMGAQPGRDGPSSIAFPSGVGAIPVEVTENDCPLVFWRRELLPGSGGAGRYRGGLGQIVEIGNSEDKPFTLSAATFDRIRHPARGRDGGLPGKPGSVRLASGKALTGKGVHVIAAGERLIIELPGGGGLGEPELRDPQAVQRDLQEGLI
jgi:N-methylhydantoinase B